MSHKIRDTSPRYDRRTFFATHRVQFGWLRQLQVDGLEFLLTCFETYPQWENVQHVAYALATIRTETGIAVRGVDQTYLPIEEKGSKAYLSMYYLVPSKRRNLGNIQLSDAWVYKGRGYVQITGRRNYTLFADLLDLPLLDEPELALQPITSFEIMTYGMHRGLFTGKQLTDYIGAGPPANYYDARRIINALDRAALIAVDARKFERCLRLSEGTTA